MARGGRGSHPPIRSAPDEPITEQEEEGGRRRKEEEEGRGGGGRFICNLKWSVQLLRLELDCNRIESKDNLIKTNQLTMMLPPLKLEASQDPQSGSSFTSSTSSTSSIHPQPSWMIFMIHGTRKTDGNEREIS